MTAPLLNLGRCMDGFCDRTALVYVAGPHYGPSARVTIISGPRAAELASGDGVANLRCIECAQFIVARVAYALVPDAQASPNPQA